MTDGMCLQIGDFTIYKLDNGNYWIKHKSGEGMETKVEKFEALIRLVSR
jgi:hypothetical protein